MEIRQIMSKPAITCRANDTLNTAAQLMWEHDCGAIPVVDDDNRVVGMITDRDICMSAYSQGGPLQAIAVSSAMARRVFSCDEGESLEGAEGLMSAKQIRRIPVVDDHNRPVGVVSLNDIARYVALQKQGGMQRDLARTLSVICEPRLLGKAPRGSQPQAQVRHAST